MKSSTGQSHDMWCKSINMDPSNQNKALKFEISNVKGMNDNCMNGKKQKRKKMWSCETKIKGKPITDVRKGSEHMNT